MMELWIGFTIYLLIGVIICTVFQNFMTRLMIAIMKADGSTDDSLIKFVLISMNVMIALFWLPLLLSLIYKRIFSTKEEIEEVRKANEKVLKEMDKDDT